MTQEKKDEDKGNDLTSHDWGTNKGEETASKHGKEAGREDEENPRTARDSTSVNPDGEEPIDPAMPHMPPA